MSALWISHVTVTDPQAYKSYATRAVDIIAEYGGVFLSRGGAHRQLEGTAHERHVVVRFPSLNAAEKCYNSDAYQAAMMYAQGASERQLVIVQETQ